MALELDVDLVAKLSADIGGLETELARTRTERQHSLAAETPRIVTVEGSVLIPVGGFGWFTMNFRGPDSGHLWFVRKIVVGGVTPTTAAAGRADVFVSAQDFNAQGIEPTLLAWRDQAVTLPLVGPYSRGELVVKSEEYLQIAVNGGTVGQTYVCAVVLEDFQDASMLRNWGM